MFISMYHGHLGCAEKYSHWLISLTHSPSGAFWSGPCPGPGTMLCCYGDHSADSPLRHHDSCELKPSLHTPLHLRKLPNLPSLSFPIRKRSIQPPFWCCCGNSFWKQVQRSSVWDLDMYRLDTPNPKGSKIWNLLNTNIIPQMDHSTPDPCGR